MVVSLFGMILCAGSFWEFQDTGDGIYLFFGVLIALMLLVQVED